jgi:hypothetical protein
MFHGLDNKVLYAAYRVIASFETDSGETKMQEGTGFFVANAKGNVCFVTNRHVVDAAYVDIKYMHYKLRRVDAVGKAPSGAGLPDVDQTLTFVDPTFLFSKLYQNDVACLVSAEIQWVGPKHLEWFVPYKMLAKQSDFEQKLSVCDFLAFPGFPPWYDKKGGRPILRTGTIASDPRYDYSWTMDFKGQCLAHEAFSFGGSSGSPVFAVQKGPKPGAGISFPDFREVLVIGINAGHLPDEQKNHSGISYLYKSAVIIEIIDG